MLVSDGGKNIIASGICIDPARSNRGLSREAKQARRNFHNRVKASRAVLSRNAARLVN